MFLTTIFLLFSLPPPTLPTLPSDRYKATVNRTSLTSIDWDGACIAEDSHNPEEQALRDIICMPAHLPSPRFSSLVVLIDELLAKLRSEKAHALVEFPRLLAFVNHRDFASVKPGADRVRARVVELLGISVARAQLRVAKQAPFDNIISF